MDVCPIPFSTKVQLLPSAIPTGFEWTYADPDLVLVVTFPVDMDETVQPSTHHFVIDVDGVPKEPDSLGWTDSKTMSIPYSEAVLGPSVVRLQYPLLLPNFKSLAGQPVFPFDILAVET
ncbi:unnamed protein product [marine sediment metagenome]|uniref:Uncharacterized protein n=1 Tax=marine sediment metagenome TaxID=412755 RepID=X1DZN1_9ZZZZ